MPQPLRFSHHETWFKWTRLWERDEGVQRCSSGTADLVQCTSVHTGTAKTKIKARVESDYPAHLVCNSFNIQLIHCHHVYTGTSSSSNGKLIRPLLFGYPWAIGLNILLPKWNNVKIIYFTSNPYLSKFQTNVYFNPYGFLKLYLKVTHKVCWQKSPFFDLLKKKKFQYFQDNPISPLLSKIQT